MIRAKHLTKGILGIGEKAFGLAFEAAGTITGSERLKHAGRSRQKAADSRLQAVDEEISAAKETAKAEAKERRQRAHQDPSSRGRGRDVGEKPRAGAAAGEGVKGSAKQAAGKVTGSDSLEREGEAQREKAGAEARASKHRAKADAQEQKAEAHRKASDRLA